MMGGLATIVIIFLLGKTLKTAHYFWYGPGYRPWRPPPKPKPPEPYHYRPTFKEAKERHARRQARKPP